MLRDSSQRSSQARLLTSAKTPPERRQSPTDRRPSSSTMTSEARRASWQQQQHHHHHHQRRVPSFGLERNHRDYPDQELIVTDDPNEQEDWRQNAQMLTERDEMLLLAGDDVLDIAPVNRRLQQARARQNQSPVTERSSSQQSLANKTPTSNQRLAQRMIFTSHTQQESRNKQLDQTRPKSSNKKHRRLRLLSGSSEREQHDDENAERNLLQEEEEADEDDNSSISFAQSGCHSILSVWRIKAANRAAKLATSRQAKSNKQQPERPTSVLSQTSSQGRRSVASTAHTLGSRLSRPGGQAASNRILLGPKSAQHFVTNTRRRRRANELIMSTLDARRRAISLSRQNATGSLFGSESYLVGGGDEQPPLLSATGQMHLDQDYQRLSLSPSPAGMLSFGRRTPSPAALSFNQTHPELTKRSALSDLGGRQSPATAAQRQKLLLAAQQRIEPKRPKLPQRNHQRASKSQSHSSLGSGRPPLAKLDQNSSDLCSSNESSSGAESRDSNSSSGSQFTQLVTSELAPSRILLEDNDEDYERQRSKHRELSSKSTTTTTTTAATARHTTRNLRQTEAPPRPPSRTKRKQQEAASKSSAQAPASQQESRRRESSQRIAESNKSSKQQQISTSTSGDDDDKSGGKLRRGALKRDSIRRLRLSRKQSQQHQEESSSSQEAAPVLSLSFEEELEKRRLKQRQQQQEAEAANKLRPLSKARKMDIENNPFLNRHHFRSLSTRSTDSRQSLQPSQQQPMASVRRQQLQQTLAEEVVRPEEEPARRVQAPTRLRSPAPRVPTGVTDRQEPSARPPSRSSRSYADEMPQVDIENVRRVERMLRDMKPGQVIRSQAREQATARSNQMETSHHQPARSTPRMLQQEAPKNASDENVFKTTTRLVRESARSGDDLKADLQSGNRRQFQMDERWRHERQVPIRLADGSIFSEEKFSSERLEVHRSQEQLSGGSNIGLPAGFSDNDPSPPAPPARRNQQTACITPMSPPPSQFSPTRPPKPSDRFGSGSTAGQQASNFTSLLASQPSSEERPKQGRPKQTEQPKPPAIKPRTSASGSQSVLHQGSSGELRVPKPLDPVKVLQASLPKFERSADDEFRKRVDHLRQMARANLEESQARQAKEAKWRRDKSRLVKPLSTNWEGPQGFAGGEQDSTAPERSRPARQPLETSSPLERHSTQRRSMQQVASTNLDDMLLADRYQRPIDEPPAGAWRRSNSSLASVGLASRGSATRALHGQPARAMSPQFGLPRQPVGLPSSSGSVLSQSALSIGPRDSELEAPVRVVVRERSAPKLDFAQVEQRPPTQLARHVEPPPPPASREITAVKTSATSTQRPAAASSQPSSVSRQVFSPTSANLGSSQQEQARAASSRPAAASPRSPEFGQTAASSNDDSAIASSVSSPSSMSFALGGGTQHQQPVTLRPWGTIAPVQQQPQKSVELVNKPFAYSATTTSTTTSTMTSSATSKQLTGLRPTTSLDAVQATPSGALQSILRRQQMAANLATSGSSEPAPTESQGIGSASNIQNQTFPMTTSLQPFQQQQPLMMQQQQQQRPATAASEQQEQRAAAAAGHFVQSSPAKRVHFNDRTSVRSFESISSTNSNTTAIPQLGAGQMNEFDARQVVGSPDSMGSSRLSESPAFGDFRAREPNSQASGGAAIYAVRGDPDFEQQPPPQFQQRQQGHVSPQPPQMAPASSASHFAYDVQRQFMMSPPQQHQQHYQKPLVMSPSSGPQYALKPNYDLQTAQFPQQQLGSPVSGSIRMTAPPAINTATSSAPSSYQHGLVSPPGYGRQLLQAQPYVMGRPRQPQVVLVSPQQQARSLVTSDSLDEDDPNYALRLRQAATQGVFNYVQPSPQQLGGGLAAGVVAQQQQYQAPKQSTGQSGGGGSGVQRRLPIDLANFQTEV